MIDFRYHLVSIISIFLALAVGIVLGAGPLQGNLGSQLTDQVSALRIEKQDLNDRLAASQRRVGASDEYAKAVSNRVVDRRLAGHGVVVIVLPSAESTMVDLLEETLTRSGATLRGTVSINTEWFDPSREKDRAEAASSAASTLGLASNLTGDALLAQVLARLTVSTAVVTASESRTAALAALVEAGLVDSSTEQLEPGDLVVIASGDFSGEKAEIERRSTTITALARALAEGSVAAVVAGPQPVVAKGKSLTSDAVAAIRSDDATARVISTVDHASEAAGPAIVVLALESELVGQVGHYGTAEGATAAVPRITQ